jgi:uncharacterized protein
MAGRWRLSRSPPNFPRASRPQALCDNRVDAILFTVGHPTGSIAEPVATCDAQLST